MACREGRPVKGRILNNVNGGFAVGIAGASCLLIQPVSPFSTQIMLVVILRVISLD